MIDAVRVIALQERVAFWEGRVAVHRCMPSRRDRRALRQCMASLADARAALDDALRPASELFAPDLADDWRRWPGLNVAPELE